MMKHFCKFIFLIFSLLLMIFSSCSFLDSAEDSSSQNQNAAGVLSGKVQIAGQVSSSKSSRTILPSFPSSDLTYSVFASSDSGKTKAAAAEVSSDGSFSIIISTDGTYLVYAEISDSNSNVVYKGSSDSLTVSGGVITKNGTATTEIGTITASPVQSDSGNAEIVVDVSEASEIASVKAEWQKSDATSSTSYTTASVSSSFTLYLSDSSNTNESVSSGTYSLSLFFYSDSSSSVEVYRVSETVQVYDNLTTSVCSGNAPYFSGNTIKITSSLISGTAYARGTGAATLSENKNGANGTYYAPYSSISDALSKVTSSTSSAMTIYIDGTFSLTDALSLSVDSSKTLSIYGVNNAENSVITNTSGTGISVTSGSTVNLKDITVSGCSSTGISNAGTLTMENCVISGNGTSTPESGGGIYNEGTLTLSSCTISGNTAEYGGGIYTSKSLTVSDSCVIGDETESVASSSSYSNYAAKNGGGIYISGGTAEISSSTIQRNYAAGTGSNSDYTYNGGGGIYITNSSASLDGSTLTITDSKIQYNSAAYGGGIYHGFGSVTMTGTSRSSLLLSYNSSTNSGAGYCCNVTATSGKTTTGAARSLTFTKGTISNNTSGGSGAGAYLKLINTADISDSEFSGNTAESGGGALTSAVYATCTLNNVDVTGNSVTSTKSGSGIGGGLNLQNGTVTLTDVSVSGNYGLTGGGIYFTNADVSIGGKISVSTNYTSSDKSTVSNLLFASSSVIEVTSALSGSIGISLGTALTSGSTQVLTSGWNTYNSSTTASSVFSSDDDTYSISTNSSGEVIIKSETVYSSWSELSSAVSTDTKSVGFGTVSYKIASISDFDNSTISLSGDISQNDTVNIVPSENLSITVDGSSQTSISSAYFSITNLYSNIGSSDCTITFGDSSYPSSGNLIYLYSDANSSFTNCVFQSASVASIETNGTLLLKDCTFKNISASGSGAVYITDGTTTLDSCTFTDCADYDVYLKNSSSKLALQGTLNTTSIYVTDYSNGALITLDTGLALSSGASPAVKIYSYKSGTSLFASSDGGEISESIRNYFTVTDESGNSYTINADGSLSEKTVLSMPSATEAANYSSTSLLASGTYSVSSATDLVNLATIVNNSGLSTSNTYEFELTSDVDLADSGFETIGKMSTDYHFTGTFDGKNHTINNLTYSATEIMKGGLFASVEKATIKNLVLEDVSVSSTKSYVGAICGRTDSETVISNCHVKSGSIAASTVDYAGGLVGANNGVIANCSNAASVSVSSGTVCGGIAGVNSGTGFIINCSNSGSSSGKGNIGGIAGNNEGFIANSVNSGTVTLTNANGSGGGIAGSNDSGNIVNCVSVGSFSPASSQSSPIGVISNSTADEASYSIYNSYGLGATNITSIIETGTYSSNSEGTSYGCKILDSSSGWTSETKIDLYKISVSRTSSAISVTSTLETQYQNVGFTSVSEALDYFVEMVDGNDSFSDGSNSWTLKTWTTDSSGNPVLSD